MYGKLTNLEMRVERKSLVLDEYFWNCASAFGAILSFTRHYLFSLLKPELDCWLGRFTTSIANALTKVPILSVHFSNVEKRKEILPPYVKMIKLLRVNSDHIAEVEDYLVDGEKISRVKGRYLLGKIQTLEAA